MRQFSLPDRYTAKIEAELTALGFTLKEPRKIAEAVLKLSAHYFGNPLAQTPWHETWAQAASLAYYFPLNYARNSAVAKEAERLGFFLGLDAIFDFGSGMGSALHAFQDMHPLKGSAADISPLALRLSARLGGSFEIGRPSSFAHTALLTSYTLTELPNVPEWWFDAEGLIIVEPSTHQDARRLMGIRQILLDRGHFIWGPCTHSGPCPLLIQSEKDWCHDRIHWQAPEWFEAIEKHLPMKNRTLTYSYLLARKSKPAPGFLLGLARLTGDTLEEKGKSRQMVCRGSEREFLAWFPQRLKEEIAFQRGDLVRISPNQAKKSSEIRLSAKEEAETV